MKNSIKRTFSADAANVFIRNFLCDISDALGRFSDEDYKHTLKYFNNCCAYTGVKLSKKSMTLDHIIPHNRKYCGLHLYGNLVPASSQANKSKGGKTFEKFLLSDSKVLNGLDNETRMIRIEKLKQFQKQSGYLEKVEILKNISDIAESKYQHIQDYAIESLKDVKSLLLTEEFHKSFSMVLDKHIIDNEIDKVKRRVRRWFDNIGQYNSQILIKFLDDLQDNEYLDLNMFKKKCAELKTFDSNFTQMCIISTNNHGKVFDINENQLRLWKPVKSIVIDEYNSYKKCIRLS